MRLTLNYLIFRFYKIFVSYLEEEFKKSPIPRVHDLIEQQFQGKSQYITICQNCNTESIRDSSFYELELGIDVRLMLILHFSFNLDVTFNFSCLFGLILLLLPI